ncbi:hypothetical protein [Dehalobacterium formicoaceticum]|uniref:Uncharacterized protein n=1 Tax=Dehalobacterium formicoaceticum TaxID=51515 RepID=A0ABT1Y2B3_9FIRM|nr:hypothetical protein [Dehalobacterium formicoaceticum]MCR6544104.1 hypothetical protein [Dehalobacterium formicoaceticum]
METTTIIYIVLILVGCILLPILGGFWARCLKCSVKIGFISVFIGSLLALAGFRLCVSWDCLCASCGNTTALIVMAIAWITFIFLALTAYCTQLKKR